VGHRGLSMEQVVTVVVLQDKQAQERVLGKEHPVLLEERVAIIQERILQPSPLVVLVVIPPITDSIMEAGEEEPVLLVVGVEPAERRLQRLGEEEDLP